MPVYKRKTARPYKAGKKPVKKRSTFSRVVGGAKTAFRLARKAYSGYKYLRGMINCEKHFIDTLQAGALISWSGTVTALSASAQGDNINNRVGDSILAKYLTFRYSCTMDSALSTTAVRWIIFQDTMSLGTIPSASDVLTTTGAANAVVSLLNIQNALQGRFRILFDKTVALSNTGNKQFISDEVIPINDHIKYTSTAGTDEGRNMLYLLTICDVNASDPTVAWSARLAYYDN